MSQEHKASAQLPNSTDMFWAVLPTSTTPNQDKTTTTSSLCSLSLTSLLRQVTTAPRNVNSKALGSGALSQLGKKSWTLQLQDADGSWSLW